MTVLLLENLRVSVASCNRSCRLWRLNFIGMPIYWKTLIQHALLLAVLCGLAGCAPRTAGLHDAPKGTPPPLLLGEFEDDYGIQYSISERGWHQQPESRYRVVRWRTDAQYLIAQNDAANPSDAGLWTRIDWIVLSDMPPFEWAFCLSAYAALTAAEAERTDIAQRETPRTGCNGHPFSRMRRKNTRKP